MKKLLLSLLFAGVTGCIEFSPEYQARERLVQQEQRDKIAYRQATLRNGIVHVGMTDYEFAKLWDKPYHTWIDRSVSAFGVTEWWWFSIGCEPTNPGRGKYAFCFENRILTFWTE